MLSSKAHAAVDRGAAQFVLPAQEGSGEPGGARLDDRFGRLRLRPDHRRRPGLQYAGLLSGNLRARVAEKALVVERDRGNSGYRRVRDDIGRVEPSAESRFEQHDISGS